MHVEVRLFATLRRHVPSKPDGTLSVNMNDSGTVLDLINQLGIDGKEVKIIMINGSNSDFNNTLQNGDRIGLFPPIGGG